MFSWLKDLFRTSPPCEHKWESKRRDFYHPNGESDWTTWYECSVCGAKTYKNPNPSPPPPPRCTHTYPDGKSALKHHRETWYTPFGEMDWSDTFTCKLCGNVEGDGSGSSFTDQEGNTWRNGHIVD